MGWSRVRDILRRGTEGWHADAPAPGKPVKPRRTVADPTPDPLQGLRPSPDPRDPRASALLRPPGAAGAGPVVVLGLPYDGGIPSRPGARFGPRALREALAAFGSFDGERDLPPLTDLGDLSLPAMNGGEAHARIEEAAARLFAAGGLPVFLGGDHGCTGSLLRGLARARPAIRLAVVNLDAHLDVREYEDADHLSSGTPFRRALETPILTGARTAMIGIRRFANSRSYLDWARARGIHLRTVEEVEARGAAAVAREVLAEVMRDADALYLSVDLDAADAAHAPGVSADGIGGLHAREMIALVRALAAEPRLLGADIMELSPPYDPDGRTARLGARLLLEVVGAREEGGGKRDE
jgi:formimidoylglutamase